MTVSLLGRDWDLDGELAGTTTIRGRRLVDVATGAVIRFTGELQLSARSPHAMWLAPWEAATGEAPAADALALALTDGEVVRLRIVARATLTAAELVDADLWAILDHDHAVPIGAALVRADTRALHVEGDATVPAIVPRFPGTALASVDLSRTPVEDIAALAAAPLVHLALRETAVHDLAPLATVATLRSLDLAGCARLSDLAPLRGLVALRELTLPPRVDDLTPLGGLAALVALDVSRREVGDAAWLRGLVGLETLDVADTSLADLAVLAAPRLRRLRADRTPITTLAPLAACDALEHLSVVGIRAITDVAPVARAALRELVLHGTGVVDLAPLARTSLTTLNLTHTGVADLAPLAGHAELRVLSLFSTPVVDLAPLAGIRALRDLDLFCSRVVDLAPLHKANLERLDLRWTRIRDLAPLAHHVWTLRRLALDATLLPAIAVLDGALVTELQLRDDGAPLELAPLAALPQLAALRLDHAYGGLPGLRGVLKLPKLTLLVAPGLTAEAKVALTRARPGLIVHG